VIVGSPNLTRPRRRSRDLTTRPANRKVQRRAADRELEEVVNQTGTRWNQLTTWLRRIDSFRQAS
jgi:hypothetical protein